MKRELHDYVLPVDKPVGPTSHDIVYLARRSLKTRRVGHTGTLDPFASGLLLLCINRATRIAEYLTGLPKHYSATARLDGSTDTDDSTGRFVQESDVWRRLDPAEVEQAAAELTGKLRQLPPRYSAKKREGVRAHQAARAGQDVDLQPVEVEVYRLQLTRIELPDVDFEVDCSSGTYVRALARDLGERLGTGGYLSALRRTAIADFDVRGAVTIDQLDDPGAVGAAATSMFTALAHLPRVELSAEEARRVRFGQRLAGDYPQADPLLLVHDDRLVGVARSDGVVLRPSKVWQLD